MELLVSLEIFRDLRKNWGARRNKKIKIMITL
jgi:hypothetical protein